MSTSHMSKAGIGSGKCIEFQNHSRFSSASSRRSSNNAQYGYISSQPSHPCGVSIENGLGNAPTSDVVVAIYFSSSVAWRERKSSLLVCSGVARLDRVEVRVWPESRVDRD